mgnify:FL=1
MRVFLARWFPDVVDGRRSAAAAIGWQDLPSLSSR